MKQVIIITGPTASGKTDVAINIAKENNGEIISCDSMQLYQKMDIGTATPSIDERQGIIHHNFDIISPNKSFNVAKYKEITIPIIEDILKKDKLPILVGGTGLYIDSILYNINFSKQDNTIIRKKYADMVENKGKEHVYQMLCKKDKEAAEKIHPNNIKRVIRALEIVELASTSLSDYQKKAKKDNSPYDFLIFVLSPNRKFLYDRIEKRVDLMLENGLVKEVNEIKKIVPNKKSTSLQAIGYKEVIWYIDGIITYEEMIRLLKRNSRHYAKRQLTWFKRYENAFVIEIDDQTTKKNLNTKIRTILEKNRKF